MIILFTGQNHPQASSLSDKQESSSIPSASSNGFDRVLLTAEVSPSTPHTAAGAPSAESAQASESTYLIGPFDTLRITVTGHPDVSRTSIVRPDGRITIPLAEDVIAANKTPEQLARDLEEKLRSTIRDPHVEVDVVEAVGPSAQRIKVIGSVGQMSSLRYREGMTLLDVVIEAGGLSPFAAGNDAVVYRRTPSGTEDIPVRLGDLVGEGDQTANIAMRPGDVVMIPEGFFTGEWNATGSLGFTTAFTDNYNLDPDGQKDPAVIFTVTPGIDISGQTGRVNAALAASTQLQYRTISDPKPDATVQLTGTSNSELVREHFFLDANASVSQQPLSSSSGTSESGSNSNQSTVSTLELSPYLLNRLGSFANVETRHVFGAQFETNGSNNDSNGNDDLSNSVTNVFSIGLGSGRDFTRFLWTNRNYVGRQTRFGASDVDEGGVIFSPEYVVKPGFSLLGDLGYEVLDDGDTNLSGPTALGGFDWRPNPTFSLRAKYGTQLENQAGEGSLRYDIGPRTTLVGTASERVETGQTSLLQTTGSLGVNPATGQFVDRRTGLAFNPRPQTVNTDNNLSRIRSGSLNLSHASGVNTFGISVFATDQKDLDNNNNNNNNNNGSGSGDQTTWGVNASWSRQIDLRTGLTITTGYEKGDGDNSDNNNNNNQSSDNFERYNFSIALNRTLSESLQGFVRYGFQKQTSKDNSNEFTENAVVIGLTYGFDL
jgi:polysaccharide export outer membrane protein